MELSDGEKLILVMLCEIYKKLGMGKSNSEIDPEFVSYAISHQNLWALKWEYIGTFGSGEPTQETIDCVVDTMDMWDFLEAGYENLSPEDKSRVAKEAHPFGDPVYFRGWDGNHEAKCISIARCLTEKLERFTRFKGRELNAHIPTLDANKQMFVVFEPIRGKLANRPLPLLLTADEIILILNARTHPKAQKDSGMPSGGVAGPDSWMQ